MSNNNVGKIADGELPFTTVKEKSAGKSLKQGYMRAHYKYIYYNFFLLPQVAKVKYSFFFLTFRWIVSVIQPATY